VAWLANAAAWEQAEARGERLAAPPARVVAGANDKAFALASAREHARVPESVDPLIQVFAAPDCLATDFPDRVQKQVERWPAWTRHDFTLKPRHGTAGRGRVSRFEEIAGAAERLARAGGAILEPWLQRTHDLSVQLYISPAAEIQLLGSTRLMTSPAGVTRGIAGTLGDDELSHSRSPGDTAARSAAIELARSAAKLGYSGPCGVDAFEFRGPAGLELRPIVELNARFTMGTVALGQLARAHKPAGTCFLFLPHLPPERAAALDHRLLGPVRAGGAPLIAFAPEPAELSSLLQ